MTVRTQKSNRNLGIVLGVVALIAASIFLTRDKPAEIETPVTVAATTVTQAPAEVEPPTTFSPVQVDAPLAVQQALLAPTACGAQAPTNFPQMQFDAPEDQEITGPLTAVISTSCGDITIELDPSISPESVNSFVFLSRAGFFDGQLMHRLITDFVVQGGDPTAQGTGGPGYTIVDEFPALGTSYPVGTVAMAKAGAPNSTGSQFFIVLGDSPHLGSADGLMFNILGHVTDGMDVVEAINALEIGGTGSADSLYLERVEILP